MTEPNGLAAALAALQAQLPHVGKDATNPHFKSKYATLEAISAALLPLLAKVGLSFSAKPTMHDGEFVLQYTLRHVAGESDTGLYPLPTGNPQQIGSAITYARRYSLCAVTGLAPDDDDDGNEASGGEPRRSARSTLARPRASQVTPAQQRAARQADPDHGKTPTEQREARARRTAEEKAVAQARAQDRPMDRGPLPDADNAWQDTAPRPATPEQKNAIKARLEDMRRPVPDMSGLGYLEAARMITDLAAGQASAGQDAAPEDRPGSASTGQRKGLEALLGQFYGLASMDRDGRHNAVQQLLGLETAPASMNDLSYTQAKTARDKIVAIMAEREREAKMAAASVPDHVQAAANDWPEDWPT